MPSGVTLGTYVSNSNMALLALRRGDSFSPLFSPSTFWEFITEADESQIRTTSGEQVLSYCTDWLCSHSGAVSALTGDEGALPHDNVGAGGI